MVKESETEYKHTVKEVTEKEKGKEDHRTERTEKQVKGRGKAPQSEAVTKGRAGFGWGDGGGGRDGRRHTITRLLPWH